MDRTHEETWLLETATVRVGVLDVPASDPGWRQTWTTPERPQIAFPLAPIRTRVLGVPARRGDRVITPIHAMRSTPGWRYEREALDERGERSLVIEPTERSALDGFESGVAAVPPEVAVALRTLVRRLRRGCGLLEPVEAEEQALSIVSATLRSAGARAGDVSRGLRGGVELESTTEAHADAVRCALELIESTPDRRLSLGELGAHTRVSPAHLARIFRKHTGLTIAEAARRSRLSRALDDILDTADDLTAIAYRYGFADSAHFSKQCSSVFGSSPSSLRKSATTGQVRMIRQALEPVRV
ncbi:MAG: AraC family transcriptional regulator [Planctomycetota bacterium]